MARRVRRLWVPGLVLAIAALAAGQALAFDGTTAARATDVAHRQLTTTFSFLPGASVSPKSTTSTNGWTTVGATDAVGWTQGFYPGLLWSMYEVTGDPTWRTRADAWTRAIEGQKTNTATHDLGFKMMCSFGAAYRATGGAYYRDVLITSANSLASRFRPVAGVISCCDWNTAWKLPLVADTMMNLELLLWTAANGGDSAWRAMALSHARATLRVLVRPDGSSFHVADFDPATGAVRWRGTYQGYSNASTWSRGHAWLVYGYTMVYRYTREPDMLAAARKVASWWAAHVPADGIPNWDFSAPTIQRDSSAAAAAASALLELATFVPDATEAGRYRALALRTLDALSSSAYLGGAPSILRHGVGDYPHAREIDVGLVYGDHYFLEAVRRHTPKPVMTWPSRLSFSSATRPLGKWNGGVRTMELDVVPRTAPIDGVIGYADNSTGVAGYSSLAMLVRMNPSGWFDVRDGGAYGAATQVWYRAGQTYHLRVVADLAARRYSVWIRPPGLSEVQVASGYAFRSDAPFTDDVGRLTLRSATSDGDFSVRNHRMTAGATTIRVALAEEEAAAAEEASGGCATGGAGAGSLVAVAMVGALARLRRRLTPSLSPPRRGGEAVEGG